MRWAWPIRLVLLCTARSGRSVPSFIFSLEVNRPSSMTLLSEHLLLRPSASCSCAIRLLKTYDALPSNSTVVKYQHLPSTSFSIHVSHEEHKDTSWNPEPAVCDTVAGKAGKRSHQSDVATGVHNSRLRLFAREPLHCIHLGLTLFTHGPPPGLGRVCKLRPCTH